MTLCERIKLIDEMIRENPDVTIKDYLQLKRDLEGIKNDANGNHAFFIRRLNQELRDIAATMNRRFKNRYNEIRK